ncbi:MAG: hypothetical protein HQK75_04390 [Candidatus Magnetomorum sp.]|nr:hypothetical protein [Candidatus Magnetomorum sp.]
MLVKNRKTILLTGLSLLLAGMIYGLYMQVYATSTFSARCIKVIDGNRIIVWLDGRWFNNRLKIKLYGIQCPDRETSVGQKARSFVISQISGNRVDITVVQKCFWGWSSAIIHYNGMCLNDMLVKNDLACFDH